MEPALGDDAGDCAAGVLKADVGARLGARLGFDVATPLGVVGDLDGFDVGLRVGDTLGLREGVGVATPPGSFTHKSIARNGIPTVVPPDVPVPWNMYVCVP